MNNGKKVICYVSGSAGDWGGASRVLFTNLKMLDRSRFEPLLLLPYAGPILEFLDNSGIKYEIWGNLHEPNGWFGYARAIWRAARFFRRKRVDLLHINHSDSWRPAEVLAAKLLRIPIITHYHTINTEPAPFVKLSDGIAAVSKFTAEHSDTQGVRTKVIYNSVDLTRFDEARNIRGELDISPDDTVVTFVGQIRKIKGIEDFIQMAKAINSSKARFLIVGECRDPKKFEGSYTVESLQQLIGEDQRIRYVGYTSEVQNIYRSSDIIVAPSRWEEPFGLINIEAGAAGKPVVATRVGGIPEVIRDGENGFLVEKGDVAGLTSAVAKLVHDPILRQKMGAKGREIVEQEFTTKPIRDLETFYEELIG